MGWAVMGSEANEEFRLAGFSEIDDFAPAIAQAGLSRSDYHL